MLFYLMILSFLNIEKNTQVPKNFVELSKRVKVDF